VDFGRLAAALIQVGRLGEAEEALVEALHREPDRVEWLSNLGGVRGRQGRYEEALEQYERALAIDPENMKVRELRDRMLVVLDAPDRVVREREGEVANAPKHAGPLVRLARAHDQAEEPEQALQRFREAIALLASEEAADGDDFDIPTIRLEMARRMIARARYPLALRFLAMAERDGAEARPLALARANALTQMGAPERALHVLDLLEHHEAGEISRDGETDIDDTVTDDAAASATTGQGAARRSTVMEPSPRTSGTTTPYTTASATETTSAHGVPRSAVPVGVARGEALSEAGRYDEAEALLQELRRTYPGHPGVLSTLGQTLMWLGRLEEAAECFERVSRIRPSALSHLIDTRDIPNDPATIQRMSLIARNPHVPDGPRGALAFALHRVHDKRKDHDTAFDWLDQANAVTGKTVRFDPDGWSRYVDRLIENWTPVTFERLRPHGHESRRPIFVVGMPRSGTTLTEQILGSHPDIYPAGELPLMPSIVKKLQRVLRTQTPYPENVAEFRERTVRHASKYYLKHVAELDDDAAFTVDKMPHNFMSLGLIAVLFPNATIIHVNRDPRDTALSNYQQNFKAKHGTLGYSVDLEWTGRHINDYHRLMNHWRAVLPVPIFELEYDALVQDQAGTTRELLDFIGVDWDEGVREFHKTERAVRTASVTQVRQGIYRTSSQKWRRYEQHLKPLLDVLDPATYARYDAAHAEESEG